MPRKKAALVSTLICLCGGILCALSFGPLKEFKIFGKDLFNLFDYISSNIFLPLGGMGCSIFVGWIVDRKLIRDQFTDNGTIRFRILSTLVFFLRWICPIAIFLVFLNSIGVI